MITQHLIVTGLTEAYDVNVAHFGDTLRTILEDERHISQRQFIKMALISPQTLTAALKSATPDARRPTTYTKIAKGLGMSVEELDARWKAVPERKAQAGNEIPLVLWQQIADLVRPLPVLDFLVAFNAWLRSEGDLTRGLILERVFDRHQKILAAKRSTETAPEGGSPVGMEFDHHGELFAEEAGNNEPSPTAASRKKAPPK